MKKYFYSFAILVSFVFVTNNSFASWPFNTGTNTFIFSSPAIADLDGDKKLEILFGAWDGYIYCVDPMGNLKWKYFLDGQINSSPTVVDLDNNPATKEVVIGGGLGWVNGIVAVLKYDGTLLASFNTTVSFPSSPYVTDLENDGEMEILIGEQQSAVSANGTFYCLKVVKNGNSLQLLEKWHYNSNGYNWASSPAAADFDNDGLKEVIISDGKKIYCFETNGSVKWTFNLGYGIGYSSPVIVDLNEDNQLDILVGTGPVTVHGVVYYLNGLTGQEIWSTAFDRSIHHTPAVGNILGDYHPEIVLGLNQERIVCLNYLGDTIWTKVIPETFGFSSPALGDLTGDGTYEILIGTGHVAYDTVYIPGRLRAYNANGSLLWATAMPHTVYSSPSLADLDDDGNLEIAFGCYDSKFYVLNHLGSLYNPAGIVAVQDTCPWPMYRHDANRTGQYIRLNILSVNDPVSGLPKDYSLFQNYPNPFNPVTKIRFAIPKSEFVAIKVYDLIGREIATLLNEQKTPGFYEVEFDGINLSSGMYFYKITAGNFINTKKMILLK